jgi:hypothetical protein
MNQKFSLLHRVTAVVCLSSMIAGQFSPLLAQTINAEYRESGAGTKALRLDADLGEIYSLNISSELEDWTPVKEWYGLGTQVDQNLFATDAASSPTNGDANFADPAVSLLLQRGVGGTGLVASWRSLDDGKARQVYSSTSTLHANWPNVIAKNAGGHRFFIKKLPGNAVFNPPSTPPATPVDAAMYSAFQSNLANFNTAIGGGNTTSDPEALPPKTSVIGSKQFYRIKRATSPDTDGDGILDKDEMARGTGPFSKNSDGDAWDDGDELVLGFDAMNPADLIDSDGDSIPDHLDVHPTDSLLDWQRVPDTIYQWTTRPVPSSSGSNIGIGDDGTLYFEKGVLYPNNTWQPLTTQVITTPFEIYDAKATGFNEAGQMVGVAYIWWRSPRFDSSAAVYWPTPTSSPVMIGRGESSIYSWYGTPTITNDGAIHVQGVRDFVPGGAFYTAANTSTKSGSSQLSYNYFLSTGAPVSDANKAAFANRNLGGGFQYFVNPNLTTRQDLVIYKNGNYTTLASNYPTASTVRSVKILPNGRGALTGTRVSGNGCYFEKADGTWAQTSAVTSGLANTRGEFLKGTAIWRNGQDITLLSASNGVPSGYLNLNGTSINSSGMIFGYAYNTAGQPSKPIIYGTLTPTEISVDLISRDELTGVFNEEGGLIEEAIAIPSVDLSVVSSNFQPSGALQVVVNCTVRDPISEFTANPANRLQNLDFYINGALAESVDLPSLTNPSYTIPVWQPYPSEVNFQRTFTIPEPRTGAVVIRAETGVNPAGNQGWDIASIMLSNAGTEQAAAPSNPNFSVRFTAALTGSADTIYGRFGTGTEAALVETATNSRRFTGTVISGATPYTVAVTTDAITFSGSADQIQAWLETTTGGVTSEKLYSWAETGGSTLTFNANALLGESDDAAPGGAPLRVAGIAKGEKSPDGSLKPFVIRLAFKTGTISQIGSTYSLKVNGVSYPVVAASNLVSGQTPPAGMEWGYVAAGGNPKAFTASYWQAGNLIPAEVFNTGKLNVVLWNNSTGKPALSESWSLVPKPPGYVSPPPTGGGVIAARAGGNYTQDQVFQFYDLLFKEYGKILKDAMEARGLVIKITNIYDADPSNWKRINFTPLAKSESKIPELWVDDELDNVCDAALALFEGLYALKAWYVRDDLRLAVFDQVLDDAIAGDGDSELLYREFHEARVQAIGDALEAFATAGEIGLAIVNEPFDWFISATDVAEHLEKGEVRQAGTTAFFAALPFICGRISKAGKVAHVEVPGHSFDILPDAQEALAKTAVQNYTRTERMAILAPLIRSGEIDSELVENLWRAGFLKHANQPSKVLQANLEVQLGRAKKWGEIAHHDLPVVLDLEFLKAGIDINVGQETGRFMPTELHKKLHNGSGWGTTRGSPWNYQWVRFMSFPENHTVEKILEFRDTLRALTANPNVDVSKIDWPFKPGE